MGLKGKFGIVCEHAQYARTNHQGKVDILIKAVRDDVNFTLDDQVRFYLTWGMRLRPDLMPGHGQVVWMCNWAGGVPTVDGREIEPNSTCGRALTQLSILWDGKVTMCCYDPLNTFPLGDLNHQTIKEIYNSEKFVTFREDHYNEKASKYDLCRLRGVSIEPLLVNGGNLQLMDGYTRYTVLKRHGQREVFAYVGHF